MHSMDNECAEDCNELEVKPIHFFKIILTHKLLEGKLMIPRKFVEKYGESLPKTAFLKAPNGAEWKINLVKDDGKILFEKGWKEFAEYHSLAEGHIVVFRYERTSNFQVFIFDVSALEIDYPPFKRVQGKRASDDHGNKPPIVESFEDYRPNQKRKDNLSLEFQQLKRKSKGVEVECIANLTKITMHHTGKKCKEGPHTAAKKITALDRARYFKPYNPSCVVFMHRSYIESKSNLVLPSVFCKKYFDIGIKRGDIYLQLENGRVWPGRYHIRETYTTTIYEISSGWKPFAMDNKLKVGDVCTFELIDRRKVTFQVYIFRETYNSNCSTSQEKPMVASKQITVLDRDRSFKPHNPSFQVVMHPSNLHLHPQAKLNLPSKFCKRYFDLGIKHGDIKLKLANESVWPARYLIRDKGNRFELTSGWKPFAKENDLKAGDVCTFELIETTKLTFQVYISRNSDYSDCPASQEPADGPPNQWRPVRVYRRKKMQNKDRLGNKVEESVKLYSNRMENRLQEIREDGVGVMERDMNIKEMENGVGYVASFA